MLEFLAELTKQLREVTPESYHLRNDSKKVKYPYLTFDLDGEEVDLHTDGFEIELSIFDHASSFEAIFRLEEQLKSHFRELRTMTDDMFIIWEYVRSNTIPTGDETIKRRNVSIYARITWRK